jgi:hypothetical protein
MADKRKINRNAKHKQSKGRGKGEYRRAAMQPDHHQECDIHAEHDEFAMGEIDEIHHAPDQRQPR